MKSFKKTLPWTIVLALASIVWFSNTLYSHCEIPCGIYDDPMRFEMMAEHATTIEKCMRQINDLSKDPGNNSNQLTRWILNKENHSDELCDIVTQYFMKQRIKPLDKSQEKAYETYVHQLTLLHKMMVYSMKCKQTTDLTNVEELRKCLGDFQTSYLESTGQKMAMHEHN